MEQKKITHTYTQLDTLIFPNEDLIYVMIWRIKHIYFENLFMSTEKKSEERYFNQRVIPFKDFKAYFSCTFYMGLTLLPPPSHST